MVVLGRLARGRDILTAFFIGYAGEYHWAMQPGVQDGRLTFSTTKEGSNPAVYYMKMSLYKWTLLDDGQIAYVVEVL